MKFIEPGAIEGVVRAPPSKSMMQRAVIIASLAHGETLITNPTFCDDAAAAIEVVQALGAQVASCPEGLMVQGGGIPRSGRLECGESGTCMRMVSAIAGLYSREFVISAKGSLMKRPVGMIEEPIRALGAECSTKKGFPPIKIKGPMRGGPVTVDGSVSSQFVSGLLIALPLCKEDSELTAVGLKSSAYVAMTQSVMALFGAKGVSEDGMGRFEIRGGQRYLGRRYAVEGDWSGAAFMLVAGAIGGSARVEGIISGLQPDEGIKAALFDAGADVVSGDGWVEVHGGSLRGFEYDATNSPDLFPPLAALACNCRGKSVIMGASRLHHKESDRAAVLALELGRLGADIKVIGDRMEIMGGKLRGGRLDSHGDHRIAMAGAVAALNSEKGVRIYDEGCVSKSYPGFFADLESLRMRL
ncbi:3-phosphoshikimate 1-carboxyvinyltransferase [Candidatus Micrarchaeota archaeon]|nr:3-phosphoshikimate 1-carboxyvinyltransferase [Candidatus Micrarchaeota archaeon]